MASAIGYLLACLGGACEPGDVPEADLPEVSQAVPVRVSTPQRLPPLRERSWLIELDVPGFLKASVAVPLGATGPRPVLVALHGRADRPEWQAGSWRGIAGAHPFILCPRGAPAARHGGPTVFTYRSQKDMALELRTALGVLKRRFQGYVASSPVVLAGFSLGAIYSLELLTEEPRFFSRAVLVEGGADSWTSSRATLFARRGGERLLFVCGQPECRRVAERAAAWTHRAGAESRVLYPGRLGHVLDAKMARAIRSKFGWVVAGDSRWVQDQ
jgi:pimeloyl-ACP methyl ester carboxylesterase